MKGKYEFRKNFKFEIFISFILWKKEKLIGFWADKKLLGTFSEDRETILEDDEIKEKYHLKKITNK